MSASLHVSSSALKLLESCPRAFGYRYLAGHRPEDTASGLVLGRAMHAALALWFERLRDRGPEASRDDLVALAHALIEEAEAGEVPILPDQDGTDLRSESIRLLSAFLAKPLRPPRILAVERPFTISVPHHPTTGEVFAFEEALTGVFDLVVEESDGGIAVIDHKIARRAPVVEQGIDLQLLVYALAAEQLFMPKQPVRLYHHLLLRNKIPRVELRLVPRVEHDVDEALEAIASDVALIHAAVSHTQPGRLLGRRRSWRCAGCSYRRRCEEDRT